MATIEQELDSFTEFARERISDGGDTTSLDELFDLWRSENPPDELRAENESLEDAFVRVVGVDHGIETLDWL